MQPLEALLGHLTARVALVVGKGGVGKTTTAGAVGLAHADRTGERVHILSTDPAHSLGDLFEQDLSSGGMIPSACTPSLTLEEMDAAERGRAWSQEVSPAIAELVERGTYLDEDDVLGLLGPSLPGMDEIMAAFRLVELTADSELERIVVDTAPTGHLLRLLDAGRVLEGWAEALAAMADKASAVAGQLAGRRVRLSGEAVIDELRHVVQALGDVLGGADFVVATTPHPVVSAETERLVAELRRRGLRVAALVRGDPSGRDPPARGDPGTQEGPGRGAQGLQRVPPRGDAVPVLQVPWTSEPGGCRGLRGWGFRVSVPGRPGASVTAERASSTRPRRPAPPAASLERPILLFAGKGGVGKSTCAAGWALHRASRRDTLLLGADPAGSLSDVLDAPVGRNVHGAPGLEVRQVEAEARLTSLKEEYHARIERVFRSLGLAKSNRLDRRVMASLLELAPSGLDEIFGLDALLDAVAEKRDVVVDGAPTGHFLRLMEMPDLALGWTRGMLRALIEYRAALGLDDVAERLLRISRGVRELARRLADPSCTGAVVVTTAGALPVAETRHLLSRLAKAGVPVAAVIHNRYSPGSAPDEVEAPAGAARILAPRLEEPPVGVEALRSFVSRWEWP